MTFDRDNEMDFENRVIAPEYVPEDAEVENPLRRFRIYPASFSKYASAYNTHGTHIVHAS